MAKICFIVGHGKAENGGYDPGARSGGYDEFKIAKEIAKYAQTYYNENYDEVCDLMNYDGSLYLKERIKKVNAADYDFIAEFHLNAGGGNGVECYYYHNSNQAQEYADKICDYIAEDLGVPQRPNYGNDKLFDEDKDGGDKTKLRADGEDYFAIIRETEPCAVLIETVFIDTASDRKKVTTASGQKTCGIAIAKAVAEVRGVKKKEKVVETVKTDIEVGDVVSIKKGAKYYNGMAIPSWVIAKKWIVSSVKGDRVVINKSEDGRNLINSPVNAKYLTVVKASNPVNPKFKEYKVKVTANSLRIRKGAGVVYSTVGYINDKGIYAIVDEKGGWGKLKSGKGWISLKYTKKV